MNPPRLRAARIVVDDFAAARHFYGHALGLPLLAQHDGAFCVFDAGVDLVVELAAHEDAEALALLGRFTGLSFGVDDIAAAVRDGAARGLSIGTPELQPWGGWLATLSDPSGNTLQLVQYPR